MDRKIIVEVNGSHIRKDGKVAGVQGEGNSTILNIIFDESWDGYAKTVTFWDAKHENSVKRVLTAELLTDISRGMLEYSVPIPPEPLIHSGKMTFAVDGYVDGVRKRSIGEI